MAYSARADVEIRFGSSNIADWADLNSNDVAAEITARIAWAIAEADESIDDSLRDRKYAVPIVGLGSGQPKAIIMLSSTLAGLLLYESRGVQDVDPDTGSPIHRYAHLKRQAKNTLQGIIAGRIRLYAVEQPNNPTQEAPTVVKPLAVVLNAWEV